MSEDGCEDCTCEIADGDGTEEVVLPTTLDLSTFIRNYVEEYGDVDEDAAVLKFEVCSEETVAVVEAG